MMSPPDLPVLPILPDVPVLSWAIAAAFALLVLDVSTTLGEHFRALEAEAKDSSRSHGGGDESSDSGSGDDNGGDGTEKDKDKDRSEDSQKKREDDAIRLRETRRTATRASLEAIAAFLTLLFVTGEFLSHSRAGMDGRMISVLEGVSRLEGGVLMSFASVKIPRWVGVYASREWEARIRKRRKERRRQQLLQRRRRGDLYAFDLDALRSDVRRSVGHCFALYYFSLLPFFCGGRRAAVVSALTGALFGFLIDVGIYVARRKEGVSKSRWALGMALALAFLSSVLFADGCHYIQRVWRMRIWKSEWGLGLTSFFSSLLIILLYHKRSWYETEEHLLSRGRFPTTRDKLAFSLILSRGQFATMFDSLKSEESEYQGHIISKEEEEEEALLAESKGDPTWCETMTTRYWTPFEIGFTRGQSVLWVLVGAASVFLVIVNVGATSQMSIVRANYHAVHSVFYEDMEKGPVCAFDEAGSGERGVPRTFESREAARAAEHLVAHCGACGQCSDWHNLRLQYTTRTYLAAEAAKCARKSLYGGRSDVVDCLGEAPIGFRGGCSECWTDDIYCARSHCAFIFLQSLFINTVTNFEVDADTVTAATCEEAMCELEFVPCSGANRRRMNIASTIARPGDQLCPIVDVEDWADIFSEGGESGVGGGVAGSVAASANVGSEGHKEL